MRVGRPILTSMLLAAALFLFLGLDLILFHTVVKPEYIQEQPFFVWLLFGVFFLLVPALIIWKMVQYLIRPPIMLRVDENSVSFGTGFGYRLYAIPTRYMTSVGFALADPSLTDVRPESWVLAAGLRITFQKADDIPAGLVTSAGITYGLYRLKLRALYMNMRVKTAIRGIEPFLHGHDGQIDTESDGEEAAS